MGALLKLVVTALTDAASPRNKPVGWSAHSQGQSTGQPGGLGRSCRAGGEPGAPRQAGALQMTPCLGHVPRAP